MLLLLAIPLVNALSGIDVNLDTSNEPEIPQFSNALPPNHRKDNVGQDNPSVVP